MCGLVVRHSSVIPWKAAELQTRSTLPVEAFNEGKRRPAHTWDVVVKTPIRAGRHLSLHVALRFCENNSMIHELEERLHRGRRKFKQLEKVMGQKIYAGIFVESEVIPGTP